MTELVVLCLVCAGVVLYCVVGTVIHKLLYRLARFDEVDAILSAFVWPLIPLFVGPYWLCRAVSRLTDGWLDRRTEGKVPTARVIT